MLFEKVGERLKGIIERQINFDGLLEDSRAIVILLIVKKFLNIFIFMNISIVNRINSAIYNLNL